METIFEEMCLIYSGMCAFLFFFSFLLGVHCNSLCTEMQDLSVVKLTFTGFARSPPVIEEMSKAMEKRCYEKCFV